MTADEMKQAAAKAAAAHVPDGAVVGVGTGSTVNHFIDELIRIKGRIEGAVSSSRASTERLKAG
ncbi:MAG: ribose 5-phosphate isomerase A, partial [Betaproteobacteria bacterium]|nr:ribose 5-phosphate isomerase A [Betaproteobacteria bacterium]